MRDLKSFHETSAHILSIHINPKFLKEFEDIGFMFGVKLSFNKRFLGITHCRELFQSVDKASKGCLNENGKWTLGTVFYRNAFSLGRLKFFMNKGLMADRSLLLWHHL
jgi:hypothetical protein